MGSARTLLARGADPSDTKGRYRYIIVPICIYGRALIPLAVRLKLLVGPLAREVRSPRTRDRLPLASSRKS